MTTAVTELYDALRKAGVDEASAMGAAKAVSSADLSDLTTKLDPEELRGEFKELRGEFNEVISEFKGSRMPNWADLPRLKADIIRCNTGTLIAATGIFAAIVKLF